MYNLIAIMSISIALFTIVKIVYIFKVSPSHLDKLILHRLSVFYIIVGWIATYIFSAGFLIRLIKFVVYGKPFPVLGMFTLLILSIGLLFLGYTDYTNKKIKRSE